MVRLAIARRHHADHLLAPHFGPERAAHAAIGAGCRHGALRHTVLDDGLLVQRRRRAGLHARAARHAFGLKEALCLACSHARTKPAPLDRQRKCSLDIRTRPHAARAGNALRWVIGEIRIALVHRQVEMVRPVSPIAHLAQANGACHVLQLAVAIGAAGQAVERMVRNVKLHHVAPKPGHQRRLRAHHHAIGHRRRARGWRPVPPIDLHHAQPARPESLEAVGGAKLRDVDARLARGAQHRRALGHRQLDTIDGDMHHAIRHHARRPEVPLRAPVHDASSCWRRRTGATKSSGKCRTALSTG